MTIEKKDRDLTRAILIAEQNQEYDKAEELRAEQAELENSKEFGKFCPYTASVS